MRDLPTRIFVSHGWVDNNLYIELIDMLNLSGHEWINLSISEKDALHTFNRGEEAWKQEMDLQIDRLKLIRSHTWEYQRKIESESAYQIEETKLRTNEKIENINVEIKRKTEELEKEVKNIKANVAILTEELELKRKEIKKSIKIQEDNESSFENNYQKKIGSLKIELSFLKRSQHELQDTLRLYEKWCDIGLLQKAITDCSHRLEKMIKRDGNKFLIKSEKNHLNELKKLTDSNLLNNEINYYNGLLDNNLMEQQKITNQIDKLQEEISLMTENEHEIEKKHQLINEQKEKIQKKIDDDFKIIEKRLQNEIDKKETEIKNIEQELQKDVDKKRTEIKNIELELQKNIDKKRDEIDRKLYHLLEDERQCKGRIEKLKKVVTPDYYGIYNKFDGVLLNEGFEGEEFRLNPNLALSLHNIIYKADLFIVIGQPFRHYKIWMYFELQTALRLNKRIICLIPPDKKSLPPDLQKHCNDTANNNQWDGRTIISVQWEKDIIINNVFSKTWEKLPQWTQ